MIRKNRANLFKFYSFGFGKQKECLNFNRYSYFCAQQYRPVTAFDVKNVIPS